MKLILLALAMAAGLGAQNLSFYLDTSNGALPPSQLTPLPANYAFPDTPVGSAAATMIRVVNNGTAAEALTFFYVGSDAGSTAVTANFNVTGYDLGTILAPGASKDFLVNFTPTAVGAATGYLQASDAGLPLSVATLSGNGTGAQLTLSCQSSAAAQCNGSTLQPSSTAAISFGNVLTTATVSIPFTLTNSGSSSVNPQSLVSVTTATNNPNTPFTLSQLPGTLAANSSVTFTVTFAPGSTQTFLTNLLVGSSTFAIQGTGIASVLGDASSLAITYTDSTGVRLIAQPGAPLSFGQIVNGTTTGSNTLRFTVSNPATTISPVTVPTIAVTGSGYAITGAPPLPASIAPGSSIGFNLVFTPTQTGTFSGTLSIGARQFNVTAQAVTSPVPDASLSLDVQPLVSGKQVHLSVKLAAPSPIAAIGTLTMAFTPAIPGITDDPAIQFLATAGRQLQVNIASGGQTATYNGDAAFTFQSGTTAGTLSFTLELPNKAPYQQSFTIAPGTIQITNSTAVRQDPNLVVTLTGYDNTYSAGQLQFNFLDANGKAMTAKPVSLDASAPFHTYFFGSESVGGAFSVQATFPVVGDITKVASVAVVLNNSAGATNASQTFP